MQPAQTLVAAARSAPQSSLAAPRSWVQQRLAQLVALMSHQLGAVARPVLAPPVQSTSLSVVSDLSHQYVSPDAVVKQKQSCSASTSLMHSGQHRQLVTSMPEQLLGSHAVHRGPPLAKGGEVDAAVRAWLQSEQSTPLVAASQTHAHKGRPNTFLDI